MTDRKYFFRTFGYMRPYILLYAFGVLLYSAQAFGMAIMNAFFIGGIMEGIVARELTVVFGAIRFMAVFLVVFMVSTGIGTFAYVMTLAWASRDMTRNLVRAFMKSSLENTKHSGEGIAALNTDVDTASNIFSDAFTPFLSNIIAIVFSAATVFVIDWRLGVGAVVVGIIIFVAQYGLAAPLAKLGKDRLNANADAVKATSNIFAGALTIRAFGRQQQSLIAFDKENGRLKKLAFRQAFIGMWQDVFTSVQGWLSMMLIFALGGWFVINGSLYFHELMMVFPLAGAMSSAMAQIGTTYAGLQPPIVAAKRVFDVIDSVPEVADNAKKHVAIGDSAGYEIDLRNLSFAYQNADQNALTDVKLSINENEMVAFVGESGSGKSTLLRLIMGMYERDNLSMEIGGLPFTAQNLMQWRSHFSYVDQTCKLFDMTISENIAMGSQGTATDDEIKNAATRAFADEFITSLPDGYDTDCGEKGGSLSGGQKQRIAIARALCRKAEVLVFDEATSALDAESERNVMQTIENLRRDHTILITTHNLHNIKTADKIVVMDNGRIAEVGTHDELFAKGGIYAKLLKQQS